MSTPSRPGKPSVEGLETVVGGPAPPLEKTVVSAAGGETVVGDPGAALDKTRAAEAGEAVGKPASAPAELLGDFRIQRKLGQGGMGAVYLAHQISLDRPCALKVMARELASKPGFIERFLREARSMAKMQHPHVVQCYAVGEDRGTHYVAMELMDGKSIRTGSTSSRS